MSKDKYLLFIFTIHLVVVTLLIFRADNVINEYKENYTKSYSEKLSSIVQTISKMSPEGPVNSLAKEFGDGITIDESDPRYLRISNTYKDILTSNNLEGCEMSFIVFDKDTKSLFRLVSSEPIYASGERFKEADSDFLIKYSIGGSQLIKLNNSIWKIEAFTPVTDFAGQKIGILRAESENIKDRLDSLSTIWPFILPIAFYILVAALITPVLVKKRKDYKLNVVNTAIHEELKQKNSELKMLSLVAKKSENLMLVTDDKGQILWVNETYEMKNNYTARELNEFIGKYLQEVSKNEHIRTIIKNVVDFKKAFTYESSSTNAEGDIFYAMTTVSPVIDETSTVTNLLFVDTDVTAVKKAQQENEVYREFVVKSKFPRLLLSTEGNIQFANPAASGIISQWTDQNETFKDDVLAMLQGICDSGIVQEMRVDVSGLMHKLSFHPVHGKNELFIIGESISDMHSREWNQTGEKRAG